MRSPVGRLLYLVISLAVAGGIAYFLINKTNDAVNNTTTGSSSSPSGTPSGTPSQDPNASLYVASNLQPAVGALRKKAGSDQLLEVSIIPSTAKFTLRKGKSETAYGQQWDAGGNSLQDFNVNIVGSGTIAPQAYALSQLQASAPEKLVASVREATHLPDGEIQAMTLKRNPATSALQWTVVIQGGGRTLTAQAKPNGSGVKVL